MERTRRVVTVATVIGVLLLVLASIVLAVSAWRQVDSWRWVVHTREVLETLQEVDAHAARAEAEQRSFLLTLEPQYLDAYREQVAQLRGAVERVATLTSDNAVQQARIPMVRAAVEARVQRMERGVAKFSTPGNREGAELQTGRLLMEKLRAELDTLRAEETRLLGVREQQVHDDGARMAAGVLALVALSVVLLLALRYTARRDLRRLELAQRQLKEANASLEERVVERTNRLEEANGNLDAFARTVAHDLRTPLRNIEGLAEAVLEDERALSTQGSDYLDRIRRGANRMDQLVTGLLQFSRATKDTLPVGVASLEAAVRAALEELGPDLDRRGARVEVDPGLPPVVANAPALVQVLCNLVGNAIKFVEPSVQPRVRIAARQEGDCVAVEVRDNGIGIAREHQDRIWRVFERLHPQERYDGTGIGLAFVRQAVEQMGGTVQVDSDPGRGSTFTVRLRTATMLARG